MSTTLPTVREVPDHAVPATTARARNEAAWRRSSALLYARRIDEFVATWTPDGRYEAALPVPGLPAVITGTADLHAAFTGLVAAARTIGVSDVLFLQTDDPDVAVIEERMHAELADGSTYDNRMCMRVTFRDGLIAEMVEYYGQFAHADLLARLGLGG
jgi:ketosteroid isomerase-like protein